MVTTFRSGTGWGTWYTLLMVGYMLFTFRGEVGYTVTTFRGGVHGNHF